MIFVFDVFLRKLPFHVHLQISKQQFLVVDANIPLVLVMNTSGFINSYDDRDYDSW